MMHRDKKPRKKKASFLPYRKKVCQFCTNKSRIIDYKDLRTLESFIRERGRIISTRASGNCAKHQRELARAIRKARFISLLPFVKI
jgi:small subunit ribosomal protein S18